MSRVKSHYRSYAIIWLIFGCAQILSGLIHGADGRVFQIEDKGHILLGTPVLWRAEKMKSRTVTLNQRFHFSHELVPLRLGQFVVSIANLQGYRFHNEPCASPAESRVSR